MLPSKDVDVVGFRYGLASSKSGICSIRVLAVPRNARGVSENRLFNMLNHLRLLA